ncbi:SlyX family protein [Halobacteriovorax sp.]|uniref:SlyX family protein n=1 Tax=Halobacteriovorax sp. TaxID=2020862 RepID=UPI00356A13D2
MNELEQRLVALEEKYSYQDELVNELNKIVADQQTTIRFLVKEIKGLSEMAGSGSSNANSSEEKPPHY